MTLTSVLALALALAAPVSAEKPGDDNGNGHGNSQSANKANKGNVSKAKAPKGNAAENRGNQARESSRIAASETRGPARREQSISTRGNNAGGQDKNNGPKKSGQDVRGNDRSNYSDHRMIRSDTRRYDERGDRDRFRFTNDDDRRRFAVRYDQDYGLLSGFCPPGLAKKGNGCLPPGQAKKSGINDRYYRSSYSRFGDRDWRYYNGYAYRNESGNGLINAFLPLVGGALFGGNTWPTAYQDYSVPQYYNRYYGRDDDYGYRYADRTIFRVNRQDQGIMGIVALLTGDDFEVGRRMPTGYDVYNVPYQYREQYYDRPDAQYRYSDGYVYQIDPKTRLIAAAIELIV